MNAAEQLQTVEEKYSDLLQELKSLADIIHKDMSKDVNPYAAALELMKIKHFRELEEEHAQLYDEISAAIYQTQRW